MNASCASWKSSGPSRYCEHRILYSFCLPSPVLRLSSPANPWGISRGPQPPGRWGRIPKGTAFGIGSLWRISFASFFGRAKKEARRRRRDMAANGRGKRRIRRKPGGSPTAAGTGTGRRFFRSCGSDLLSQRGERRQRRAQGNLFRGGSLGNPSPTTKGAPPPLDSPLLDERRRFYGGRRRKDI